MLRDSRTVETLGRGDCFGEIALLRDCVRTATVRASAEAPLRVSVLPRNPFLTAVTGYPASATAGERVVTARLEALAVQPPPSRADRLDHQEARLDAVDEPHQTALTRLERCSTAPCLLCLPRA